MLQFLRQVVLFIYLLLFRKKQRKNTIDVLTSNTRSRRHIVEIPELPTVIDNVTNLPRRWRDIMSFVAFSKEGLYARFEVNRFKNEGNVLLELDLPGIGQFSYKENIRNIDNERNDNDSLWWSGKLQIRAQEPMRRWRLKFRGSLNGIKTDRQQTHAVVSCYWQCLSDPYDFIATPSCWTLAKILSPLAWADIGNIVFNNNIWYQQWGELRGTISIDGSKELNIRLKSTRERHLRSPATIPLQPICSQYLVLEDSGHAFSSNLASYNGKANMYFGFTTFPIGDSHSTELLQISPQKPEHTHYTLAFPQILKACGMTYVMLENMQDSSLETNSEESDHLSKALTVNDRTAYGIQRSIDPEPIHSARNKQTTADETIPAQLDTNHEALIVDLDKGACTNRNLVGGKASHLSILRFLKGFNVPKGLCLTVNAWKEHINKNKDLNIATEKIKMCLKNLRVFSLKEACDDAVKAFYESHLNEELETSIRSQLESLFGKEYLQYKFAIRSSGIGEDSSESSSAGQMDTFLNIQGFENIIDAVRYCWSSSVSYQVVDYRRQNGQDLIESMGVVIQEMVDADVAGVLFTNDPITGDESKMCINATYGLGESVVSGKITPDSIVIKRKADGVLEIETITIGDKLIQVTSQHEKGEMKTAENNTDTDKKNMCLKKNDVYRICKQGLEIESKLNSAQDIEWALSKDTLYILQARPITTFGMDADEEFIHEFDSPLVSNSMLLTTANVQEMMPGAVSTLTSNFFGAACERSLKLGYHRRLGIKFPVHVTTSMFTFSGIPMLNLTPVGATTINSISGAKSKTNAEIFVVGQSVKEHTLEMIRNYYGRQLSNSKIICKFIAQLLLENKADSQLFEYYKNIADTYEIGDGKETAKELYDCIDRKITDYFEMWHAYVYKSRQSSTWSGIVMAVLKGKSEDMSIENLADVASILSECKDVYSAEVPLAIKRLAKLIADSDSKDLFLDMTGKECASLLKNSENKEISEEFARFMQRHGHRGIREAEFLEKSWFQDPSDLMQTLKMIVKQGKFEDEIKTHKTVDEIVESLKTPLSRFKKLILKYFLVEKAMKGVCSREMGKSVCIKFSNVFKQAYWKLAHFMVLESRLPDPKLLFFLTHSEIGKLLEKRSANLIRLAKRRMRVYPKMNDTSFSKINIGLPAPIRKTDQIDRSSVSILQGMPVCCGKAKGRACVIKLPEDAHQIEEGDVLVCRYTDVGWSPYFPLISGLVTELGGLLSHGAVVARECGIPCIVNTPGATDLVKTGDMVLLDGSAGTFGKLCV